MESSTESKLRIVDKIKSAPKNMLAVDFFELDRSRIKTMMTVFQANVLM